MDLNFKPLSLQDKPLFDKFLSQYPQEISELTFTNLFCWRLTKNYTFTVFEDHLLISFNNGIHFKFLSPIGPNPVAIIQKVARLYPDRRFRRIDSPITNQLGPDFLVKHTPEMDDYVYQIDDLKNLPGKKYDGKRNFIKNFETYNPHVCTLDKSKAEAFMAFQQRWCVKNNCQNQPDLLAESLAIGELFYNLEPLKVFGICIVIKDQIEGFAIGEAQTNTTIVEHFEKANTEFRGIYQYLLHAFVKTFPEGYTFLNREQDLGIPGLQKSKLSYHPVKMIEKSSVKLLHA